MFKKLIEYLERPIDTFIAAPKGFAYKDCEKFCVDGFFGPVELMYNAEETCPITGMHAPSHFTAFLVDQETNSSVFQGSGTNPTSAVHSLYREIADALARRET